MNPVRWSYRLLGAALAGLAVQGWASGHLRGQAGELWLRRLPALPLLPPAAAVVLWILMIACGACVALGVVRRAAVVAGTLLLLVSLSQCWFNQKMLLTLTFLALALDPPEQDAPAFGLVKAQLLLVYAASVVFKLRDGFWSGDALAALVAQMTARGLHGLLPVSALGRPAALSVLVLAAEALLPFALVLRPRAGAAAVLALHAGLALFMPGIWPFSLTMAGAAVLFLPARDERPAIG
jgi:hypothetical protein